MGQRPACREPRRLVRRHVRRMNEAPARVEPDFIEQPRDRAPAGPGEAVFDLLRLLCRVNVNRTGRRERDHARQLLRRHGAQAVGRNADVRIAQPRNCALRSLEEFRKAVRIVEKPPLSG